MSEIAPPPGVPWFFAHPLPDAGEAFQLPREEAKHATGSRRLAPGDELVLFDGRGRIAIGRLGGERSRDGAGAIAVERVLACEPPSPSVTIATAVPKGDRWSTLLDMLGQLGATGVVPIDCERSVVRAGQVRRERAERILLEACKQARRAWCPVLDAPSTPIEVVRRARRMEGAGALVMLAHPGGEPLPRSSAPQEPAEPVTIVIGPEGGFTEREIAECRAEGAIPASLGDPIFRVETAGVVALALIRERTPAPKWSVPGSNR